MQDIMKQTAQMWKYKTVSSSFEVHTEYDNQYAVLPGCKVIGARARGKKHKHDGSNCDDWFEIGFVNDWTVAAVADGAGSKKLSRIGAKVASQSAVTYIVNTLTEFKDYRQELIADLKKPVNSSEYTKVCSYLANILQNSFNVAKRAIEQKKSDCANDPKCSENLNRDVQLNDFSTTLLLTLVIPLSPENIIITVQIGDGAVVALNTKADYKDAVRVLTNADDKSKFAGETEFILSENVLKSNELMSKTKVYRGNSDIVMLMTDGVADDYFPYTEGAKRLYLDLLANVIFNNRKRNSDVSISGVIPRPMAYPWVNDPDVKISLQYTSNICNALGKPLSYLWENRGILSYYTRYVSTNNVKDKGERLLMWLDNYVERGSFDDRTLVILQLNTEE
ncbi:MAG: protein phosphatase 2C domain-containing protein [Oscillospiraceae bacterium]|jgi:serine/threonine protein phosphatase PrpC|nr:protein phosphatase 2C domain-containing protein [Oscillospiraceae bacterium]